MLQVNKLSAGDRPAVARAARHSLLLIAAFSAFYFPATAFLASRKPLWTDELYTVYAAELASPADILRELRESADAMPPLTHILTHLAGRPLGLTPVSVRLPAILGYWLACVSIFAFLRRRVSLPLAAVGLLMPLTVPAVYAYAIEARGYGLLLGFAGAAVLCWDLAESRRWAIPGLALCLAAAVGSHLYGVLLVPPLVLAEWARGGERGRQRWGVFTGLAASGLVVIPLAPFLANMRNIGLMMAAPEVDHWGVFSAWSAFLSTPITYAGLVLPLALTRPTGPPDEGRGGPGPAACDWVLALALAAIPLWGYLLASLVTRVFIFRYVLPAAVGFSLLVPFLLHAWLSRAGGPSWVFACWLAVAVLWTLLDFKLGLREVSSVRGGQGPDYLLKIQDRIPDDGLPVVVSEYHNYTRLRYYAGEPLRPRLVCLTDYHDWIRSRAPLLTRQYGFRLDPLDDFIHSHKEFYLYVSHVPPDLVLARLVKDGARLHDVGLNETRNVHPRPGALFKVVFPE